MEKEVRKSSIVNSSLDTLKSSFLDVYYYHTGALAYLREQVDVLGVDNKEEALAIIEGQTVKLQDSLTLVEELIQNVKGIDFESRKLQDQFAASQETVVIEKTVEVVPEVATEAVVEDKKEEVAEVATEATTEVVVEETTEAIVEPVTEVTTEAVVEESTEAATEAVAEESTEAVTEAVVEEKEEIAVPQVVADDSQEEATEPEIDPERAAAAKKEIEESIAATFKDLVGEDRVVKNKDGSVDFGGVLPKEVTSRLNGRRSLADIASAICAIERERTGEAAPLVNDGPVIAVEENSEVATEVVAEEVTEAVVEETTEAVVEIPSVENQVIIPTIAPPAAPEVVSKEAVSDEVSAALNEVATEAVAEESTEVVAEETVVLAIETEVEEVATEVVADETGLRRFIDGEGQPKAILVSEVQYSKLSDSRVTQEALLKFKHVLPEVGRTAQTSTVSVTDTDSMTDDEKRRTIEVMMADANELYNSGKVEEAQAMYDKISELNKTLVKN